MTWYEHLYVGEKARKQRFLVIQKLRERKAGSSVYVIVLALNEKNLLDIYSAPEFFAWEEWAAQTENKEERMIFGIALGYAEALQLAGTIVDEVYQATGGFAVKEFLCCSEHA